MALVLTLAAAEASAGAWPREEGGVFLSLRRDFERSDEAGDARSWALYGEYGLSRRVTVGGQFSDHSSQWNLPRAGGFLRFALGDLTAANRFSFSVGASTTPDILMADDEARLDLGVHWGRGFGSQLGPGWATWSYLLHFSRHDASPTHDVYGTIGLRPRPDVMLMLSGNRYAEPDRTFRKLTPAVGYALRENLWGILQVTQEFGNAEARTFGVAVWWSF